MKRSNCFALFAVRAGAAALAAPARGNVKIKSLLSVSSVTPSAKITSNPGEDSVFRVLADDLNAKAELSKDIPLNSRITLTETTPQGTQESVTLMTKVVDVSQTVLPKSLFELLKDYKQITPPPYSLLLETV